MKLILLIICSLIFTNNSIAQIVKDIITTEKKATSNDGEESVITNFYNKEYKKTILKFRTDYFWGDCNSMGYEFTKYEFKKDTLIFYTLSA